MTSKGNHINRDSLIRDALQHIQMAFLKFKMALYSIVLVMKHFNNSRKLKLLL